MPSRLTGRAAAEVKPEPIALIAGSGDLPLVMARTLERRGREVFVVAVDGEADRDYSGFANVTLGIGAAGKLKSALHQRGCVDVMMAGNFRRPRFSDIRFDLGTLRIALSTILNLRFGGDDRVVNGVVRIFESEGFRIVGPRDAVPELVAPKGVIGRIKPDKAARADIAFGVEAISHMGRLDIGQSVVVLDRRIVSVEAAEGTTAAVLRCAELRANGRIATPAGSGVLVKMPKPGQETRLDMPVIGVDTVRAASDAGLAGLAVEAEGVLVVGLDEVREAADAAGLFLFGIAPAA